MDRVAARILAKVPWWAHPPAEVREKIIVAVEKQSFDVAKIIDVTKPPPPGVEDHRGKVFADFRVLGYADHKVGKGGFKSTGKAPPPGWIGQWKPKMARDMTRIRYWWVFQESSGEIFRARWQGIKNRKFPRS